MQIGQVGHPPFVVVVDVESGSDSQRGESRNTSNAQRNGEIECIHVKINCRYEACNSHSGMSVELQERM